MKKYILRAATMTAMLPMAFMAFMGSVPTAAASGYCDRDCYYRDCYRDCGRCDYGGGYYDYGYYKEGGYARGYEGGGRGW